MRWIDLKLDRNEASDLLRLESPAVLEAHGWDLAYYVFLDEDHLDDAVGILGHRRGEEIDAGWEHVPVATDCGRDSGKTDDSEASARHDGYVYVVGSHYGKKAGPLQPARHWIARFEEDRLRGHLDDLKLEIDVQRNKLRLHRAINDALAGAEHLDLVANDDRMQDAFVAQARSDGRKDDKKWAKRLEAGDYAMNVEGAAFRPNGHLLLGLRFPVSATGDPVVVELGGVPESFSDDSVQPHVVATYRLRGPGAPDRLVGFRAMSARGDDSYDCILGSLDANDKGSLLLDCYPAGSHATSEHWRFSLADAHADADAGGTGRAGVLDATLIKHFPDQQRIEGLAPARDGEYAYVVDEDHRIHLRFLGID